MRRKIRQGQTATHNVLAEAVTADAEEDEGEEEEEAQKDEYVAEQNEKNYSTFRAGFMPDHRLQAESAANREEFMAAMWIKYDFVPKPERGRSRIHGDPNQAIEEGGTRKKT